MYGASIASRGSTPRYIELAEPVASEGETRILVQAAALSNLVRAQASGEHYSSGSEYPFTPGNDGVGLRDDGKRVYFLSPRSPYGSMADISVVRQDHTLELPDALDSTVAAAMGNPGLATWGALLGRAAFQPGQTVLINGATGVTGRVAIQVARKLGASRIVATGRSGPSLEALHELGADQLQSVSLTPEELTHAFRDILAQGVDVVLDYLWGDSAASLLRAAAGHGSSDKARRLRFVQVGAISGGEITLPASVLRSSGVELLGSGLGSLGTAEILTFLKEMYRRWSPSDSDTFVIAEPLQTVEAAWGRDTGGQRLVFVP